MRRTSACARLAALLKIGADDVPARVAQLVEERRKLEKELADAKKKLAMGGGGNGSSPVTDAGAFKLMARTVEGINPKDLKGMADEAKAQLGSGVIVLINVADDGKAAIVTAVTQDLTEKVSAVDLVRIGSEALGGRGGGGRPGHGPGRRTGWYEGRQRHCSYPVPSDCALTRGFVLKT